MNTVVLISLALLPALLVCLYIYSADKHAKEDLFPLALVFLLGTISTVPAFFLESWAHHAGLEDPSNVWKTGIFSFLVIGFGEELFKCLVLVMLVLPRKFFDEPFDGIVYAVMVGMGFATIENLLYAYRLADVSNLLIRAFTAVPAHAAFAVIFGYYLGKAKFDQHRKWKHLVKGFLIAGLLHGTYDFFILLEKIEWLGGLALIALILSLVYARKMIQIHQRMTGPENGEN